MQWRKWFHTDWPEWLSSGRPWITRTQPPIDGSRDGGPVVYLRRDVSSAWLKVDPVLAEREVAYETDTDTFTVGDGETRYTGLPRYVRINL